MMNTIRISSRFSPFSCFGISSKSSLFIPKKGNFNPLKILSLGLHTSTNPKNWYGFEDIKNLDDAVTLFDQMLQLKPMPAVYDYNKLLHIVVKMKYYSECIYMFKRLGLLGCEVNDYTMNIVINCYCKLREVELGFAVVASFVKRGYGPNTYSINFLIKGWFMKDCVDKAVELFSKVVKDKLCEVNEFSISIMMDGLCKGGKVDSAVEFLGRLEKKDCPLDVVVYGAVIDGLCKSGKVVSAVELLRTLEKRNCELNVVVYTTVMDGLFKASMVKDALALLFRMIDRGIIPDVVTYTSLIHGLCNHNRLDFALSLFKDLHLKGIRPDVIAYTVVIQGLCQQGLFRDVNEMIEKMELVGVFPDSVTYNIIIQGCLKHHNRFYSFDLFKKIIARDFQLDAQTFFLLLRGMQNSYGGDVKINNLIRKLSSGDTTRHKMQGSSNDVMSNSLLQKLTSSDTIRFMK